MEWMSSLRALLVTVLLEGGLLLLVFRRKDLLLLCTGMNLMTNALLQISVILSSPAYFVPVAVLGEILVFSSEALLYLHIGETGWKKALLYSFTLNASSLGVGFLL